MPGGRLRRPPRRAKVSLGCWRHDSRHDSSYVTALSRLWNAVGPSVWCVQCMCMHQAAGSSFLPVGKGVRRGSCGNVCGLRNCSLGDNVCGLRNYSLGDNAGRRTGGMHGGNCSNVLSGACECARRRLAASDLSTCAPRRMRVISKHSTHSRGPSACGATSGGAYLQEILKSPLHRDFTC